jgi:multidrug efflux system membrane fusion protein
MKFNVSYIIAALAVLIIGLWFWANSGSANDAPQTTVQSEEKTLPKVVYRNISVQPHENGYRLYGRTEANREVSVKAETAGIVTRTPTREGSRVAKGQTLCQQDIDARQANLDQAKAALASAEFDLRSTQILVEKGYRSEIQLANLRAQADGARASVKSAKIELDNVNMRAPFSGMFERQLAEVGDFLAPGQPCGLLLELDPLLVVVDLSENQLAAVSKGSKAEVSLATGEELVGTVRFIEARANNMTRTFRTEIEIPNPKMALRAGITSTVRLKAGVIDAHLVPARIMALDENGEVGVRYLSVDNIVQFARTTTIDENDNGLWVTGLPDEARVIIQGQDFVSVGTEVDAVSETSQLSMSSN